MAATAVKATIAVSDETKTEFANLKTRRKHRWMVMRADEETLRIEVEQIGKRSSDVEALIKALPSTQCRFVAYDHDYERPDGRPASKLFMICWVPSTSKPSSRMFYTSQKSSVTGQFSGIESLVAHGAADLRKATTPAGKAAADDDDDPFAEDEDFE